MHLTRDKLTYLEKKYCFLQRVSRINPVITKSDVFLMRILVLYHQKCSLAFHFSFTYTTPFSINAVSVCKAAGIAGVKRVEVSKRYYIYYTAKNVDQEVLFLIHSRLAECEYNVVPSFTKCRSLEKCYQIDISALKDNLKNACEMLGTVFSAFYIHTRPIEIEEFLETLQNLKNTAQPKFFILFLF